MTCCLGIGEKDALGRTPLHLAMEDGADPAVIAVLLEHGADIEARDDFGDTPFSAAAFRGDQTTMSVLMDLGAEVGDLYWSEPTLRQLIDERQSRTKSAAPNA